MKRPSMRRLLGWSVVVIGVGLTACVVWHGWLLGILGPARKTFDGSSQNLRQTVIVPTLDTPIPDGKSAIWCSTIQLCWNHLRTDVAGEPLVIHGAEALSEQLNRATASEADLPAGSYYAAAGYVRDGILDKIRRDMASQFPGAALPDLSSAASAPVVALGYLKAGVAYTHPYFERSLTFHDAAGASGNVAGFGLSSKDESQYARIRDQVAVLFANPGKANDWSATEFVVDLCQESTPNQVVLARIPRKATLAETLAEVDARVAQSPRIVERNFGRGNRFGINDTLLVPEMHWRIEHRFRELEGADKPFVNPALARLYLAELHQIIALDLDKNGAQVESLAHATAAAGPQQYEFDRPFLLYLKKRGVSQPFFVMWVDNAELMGRR